MNEISHNLIWSPNW